MVVEGGSESKLPLRLEHRGLHDDDDDDDDSGVEDSEEKLLLFPVCLPSFFQKDY